MTACKFRTRREGAVAEPRGQLSLQCNGSSCSLLGPVDHRRSDYRPKAAIQHHAQSSRMSPPRARRVNWIADLALPGPQPDTFARIVH